MRRIVSIHLPHWPIDRWRRARRLAPLHTVQQAPDTAFALSHFSDNAQRLYALNPAAAALGLAPGQMVSDARALVPDLRLAPAEPEADQRALKNLARWCGRWSPLTNIDAPQHPGESPGLLIDSDGSDHLFGGETKMLADLCADLAKLGITAFGAIAPTRLGAWALARWRPGTLVAGPDTLMPMLADLPVAALRLDATTNHRLIRLGLKKVGDLTRLPRPALARRFRGHPGKMVSDLMRQLDRLEGRIADPFSPLTPLPAWRVRRAFAEPLIQEDALMQAVREALEDLTARLAQADQGIRRLSLDLMAVDGSHTRRCVRAGRATRDIRHLMRLVLESLKNINLGFGLDTLILNADTLEPLTPHQMEDHHIGADQTDHADQSAALVDRLTARLGPANVRQLRHRPGHIPERQQVPVPAGQDLDWPDPKDDIAHTREIPSRPPRPLRLLLRPEAIDVIADLPEGPPRRFRWRRVTHKITRAEGPERLAAEWWLDGDEATRDYYRIETESGARFWLFRAGLYGIAGVRPGDQTPPRWFLHGLFA